jgi:hypothetical protein
MSLAAFNANGACKTHIAREKLHPLRSPDGLAQSVGQKLGRSEILLAALSPRGQRLEKTKLLTMAIGRS